VSAHPADRVIALVVAMDRDGYIGRDQALPWHLPADLQRFKAITMGKPIVMGRKTHESIGRALPGRRNIIITRQSEYRASDCVVVASFEEALEASVGAVEVMVIGGASIYTLALPLAQRIYLTRVDANIGGDVRFPQMQDNEWCTTVREDREADERNPYRLGFIVLERITRRDAPREP